MEKKYSAKTNNIIALCHIIDNFEEFEKRLNPMISTKHNKDFGFRLLDVSKGKFKLGTRKAKKFYNENKEIIDTINKYSNISDFINSNYNWKGEPNGNLQFFYQYISKHKDEIDKIIKMLETLKQLGFYEFKFNENLDFTKEIYDVSPDFGRNLYIIYVDNIQVIPDYIEHISYKTLNSNYKIKLNIIGYDFFGFGREILLNSLLFDPKSFPEKIDRENTFEYILKLKKEQKEQAEIIKNSVNLGVSVLDLDKQLCSTNDTINRLNNIENKEQILEVLLSIRKDVEKLKILSSQYDDSISNQEPLLTPEVLKKEKDLYLRRRWLASLDND